KSMSESYMIQLHQMKQKIDIGRVGVLATGLIDLLINEDLKNLTNNMIAYGLAHYRLNRPGYIEDALCIREISPYLDLLDGKGERIEHNQWFQKVTNFSESDPLVRLRMSDDMYSIPIYQTNKDVSNDHKAYIIYGLEFL